LLFALILGVYAYFYQAGGWNQNVRMDLTRAIVEQGTLNIDAYHRNTGDKSSFGDHYYCDKAPGVSFVAVPAYAAFRWLGGRDLDRAAYVSTLFAVALPSALGVLAFFWLVSLLGGGGLPRLGLALAYALGTLAFPYATFFYGHLPAASALLGGFALAVDARRNGARRSRLFAGGLLLGAAIAIEYPCAVVSAAIAVYALALIRPVARLAWGLVGGAIPTAALAIYHAATFGGLARLPYSFSTQPHRHMGFFMGIGKPGLHTLGALLWSPYRGLFYSSPWLLVAILGGIILLRKRGRRAEALVCLASFLIFLWMNASLVDWQGGWAFGRAILPPSCRSWRCLRSAFPRADARDASCLALAFSSPVSPSF